MNCLIVDDDPSIRKCLACGLARLGWGVIQAGDPEEAALFYRVVDAILTDHEMPKGGGARVLAESPVGVVVHSGTADDIDGVTVLRKGTATMEDIDAALRACLDARRELSRYIVTDKDREVGRAAAARYLAEVAR